MDLLAVVGWPVIERIGPVSPHGLGIAVGYLAGSWFVLREGRKRGLDEDHIGTILLWALVGAIIGARFFYVVGHLEDFESVGEWFRIWEGGISLVGGMAGGSFFAYLAMRRFGYRFLQSMDSAAIGIAFGIFVGRIGDLVIGDHLGKPTDFFLGWAYRGGQLPGPWALNATLTCPEAWAAELSNGQLQCINETGSALFDETGVVMQGAGVHQTALYDFLIAGALFLFLRWLNRRPRREGILILSFAVLYGAGRIVTDFLRIDKTYFDTFTGSQLSAIGVILVSLFMLWRFSRNPISGEEADEGAPEEGATAEPDGDEPEDRDEATESEAADARPTTSFSPPREPGASREAD